MKKTTIQFYSDPGHGWAKVSRDTLASFGLLNKISAYSYQRGQFVYLEEDCDLSTYIQALTAAGIPFKFRESVCLERRSKIRSYDSYRPEGMHYREFSRRFDINEDQNRHSDNAVLLAEFCGSAEDIAEAKSIRQEHEFLGGLNEDLYTRRNALCAKLWPIAKERK